jgi:hypothetical protein
MKKNPKIRNRWMKLEKVLDEVAKKAVKKLAKKAVAKKPKGNCLECGAPIYNTNSDICKNCSGNIKWKGQCPECKTNFFGEEPSVCPECGYNPEEE